MYLVFSVTFIIFVIYGVVYVQLSHSSLGDRQDLFIILIIIIIKSEITTFPIACIFSIVVCRRWLCHHFLLMFPLYPAVYDTCKYLNALKPEGSIGFFVHDIISLLALCRFIWRHWTYEMPVTYILPSVPKIKSILLIIFYATNGAVRFQLTHSSCDDCTCILLS